MSVLKQRVGERLRKLNLSQSELARKADVSPSFITDIMTERKKSIRSDALVRIAAALEVEPSYLTVASRLGRIPRMGPEVDLPLAGADFRRTVPVYDAQIPPPLALLAPFITIKQETSWRTYLNDGDYLPVFAAADGSEKIILGPQPHARVGRPPQLAQARGCYVVRVPSEHLAPRYLKGELVYAQPERSLIGACWVVALGKSPLGARLGLWRVKGFAKTGIHLSPGDKWPTAFVHYADLVALHRIVLAGDDVAG